MSLFQLHFYLLVVIFMNLVIELRLPIGAKRQLVGFIDL